MNIILFWASFEKYGFGLLRSSTVWFDAPAQSIGVGQCKIDYDRSPARALIWSLISFYCPLHRLHSAQCAQPSAKLLPSQLLILHKLLKSSPLLSSVASSEYSTSWMAPHFDRIHCGAELNLVSSVSEHLFLEIYSVLGPTTLLEKIKWFASYFLVNQQVGPANTLSQYFAWTIQLFNPGPRFGI